jgi:hypothetical protein
MRLSPDGSHLFGRSIELLVACARKLASTFWNRSVLGEWGFTRLGRQIGLPSLVILSTESRPTPVHLIFQSPFCNVDVHRAPGVEAHSMQRTLQLRCDIAFLWSPEKGLFVVWKADARW